MNPILLTGDPEWSDCTVEVKVKPLSTADMAGVVFGYHPNRHYYLFVLTGGTHGRLAVRVPLEKCCESPNGGSWAARISITTARSITFLGAEAVGHESKVYVDNRLLFDVTDEELPKGKAGITANIPERFQDFRVCTTPTAKARITEGVRRRDARLQRLRSDNPEPILWKRFFTPGFGAGRSARFGDLDGDGQAEILIAQNIPRVSGDAHVVWMPTEDGVPGSAQPPYALENGDSLCFLNVSGDRARRDTVVKDRYKRFWVLNRNLEPLWHGQGQTGHFPYPFDIDGDGLDELLIGYSLWDHTGQRLWSHDEELRDHADAVFMGNLRGDSNAEPRAYVSGSDEGLLVLDKHGTILAGAHWPRANR